MRQAGTTEDPGRSGMSRESETSGRSDRARGPGAARRRRETTLLELATAFGDVLQDEGLASRVLVEVIRSGAVRTARGVPLEISAESGPGTYALRGGKRDGTRLHRQGGSA
jgi:hypothetical protein